MTDPAADSHDGAGVLFSIVIVTRNREKMIGEAVQHALAQACDDGFEVVVVDNGSSDRTAQVVEGLQGHAHGRLRLVHEARAGIGFARNAGWQTARGSWVLFLDDDALAPPSLLAAYRDWMARFPAADAWGGGARLRYPERLPLCWGPAFDGMLSALDLGGEPRVLDFPDTPYGLNMLFRREVLQRFDGFREEITFGGDETDLFWRMSQAACETRYAPGCVVVHAVDTTRFSLRWLLTASYRSGGFHARFDLLNGRLRVGWQMISAGLLKVLAGRRGCMPVALVLYLARVLGYRVARRQWGAHDA